MADLPLVDINNIEITTKYCINDAQRDKQMAYAIANIKGRVEPGPDRGDKSVAIVCYGPSLRDEWQNIKNYDYVISCSGAHKFLIDKGIIPNWHVDVDPRRHKIELLGTPHKDVEYLLASAIHPDYVDLIKNYNVKLWHGYGGDSLVNLPVVYPRGEWVFPGGCTVGLRTLLIARFLGFKKMALFGMDSSYPANNTGEHADFHPNPAKKEHLVQVEYQNITYNTSLAMIEYTRQFFREVSVLVDVEIKIHGNGLLQHMIYSGYRNQNTVRKEAIVAFKAPEVISEDYLKQNEILHQTNPYYGVSGAKYATEVLDLSQKLKTKDILDYGCGKGTLAKSLPFPIKEYDPAIPEKAQTPYPSDLVVCTDVLEHIEPELIDNVIGDIARCTKKTAFFIIHTGPALKTLPDGRNTHLIQEGIDYWTNKLKIFYNIIEINQDGNHIRCIANIKDFANTETTLEDVDKQTLSFDFLESENVKYVNVSQHTDWRIKTLRIKEPITIEWLETLNDNDILFDVGANMGLYTLWAAKNKNTKTYAFEPESQNYALLNQNIYINELAHKVKAYNLSISDFVGLGNFYITELMPGGSCHQYDSIVNFKGEPAKFAFEQGSFSVTLDYLVDNKLLPQPTHIKIDVDGLEHRVVFGGVKTLSKAKSILIEVDSNSQNHSQMVKLLNALGFYYDTNQVNRSIRKEGPFKGIGEYVFYRA